MPLTTKALLPSWCAWTMAGSGTEAGSGTVKAPIPLIVTTSFVLDIDVVDGAGGRVVVVDDDVVVVVVVVGAAALGAGPELEHAAPNAIDATTSVTAEPRRDNRSAVAGAGDHERGATALARLPPPQVIGG